MDELINALVGTPDPNAPKLWDVAPRHYLLSAMYPLHTQYGSSSILAVPFHRLVAHGIERETYADAQKTISSLPDYQLQELVQEARKGEEQRKREAEQRRIEDTEMTWPQSTARVEFWRAAAYWSDSEAVALSFGRDPTMMTETSVSQLWVSPVLKRAYVERSELVARAVESGKLAKKAEPPVFVAWFRAVGIPFSEEVANAIEDRGAKAPDWKAMYETAAARAAATEVDLAQALEKIGVIQQELDRATTELVDLRSATAADTASGQSDESTSANQSSLTRQRNTALKIVIGIAVAKYGHQPRAMRWKTSGAIRSDLEKIGISVSDDSIRRILAEAYEQVSLPDEA